MRILLLITFFLIPYAFLKAQPVLDTLKPPPALIIYFPTDTIVDLASYTTYYYDSLNIHTGLISIQNKKFTANEFAAFKINRRYLNISLWLKFSVINKTGIDSLPVNFSCGRHALVKFYTASHSADTALECGFLSFSKSTNNINVSYGINTKVPAAALQVYYVQIIELGKLQGALSPQLFLGKTYQQKLLNTELQRKPAVILNAFLTGGIFILGLFMLAQYFSNKDKAYLFYALHAFSSFLFLERAFEFNFNLRFVSLLFPFYFLKTATLLVLAGGIFYILFLQHLFGLKKYDKQLYKWSRMLVITLFFSFLLLTSIILFYSNIPYVTYFSTLLAILPLLCILLLTLVVAIRIKNNPLTRFVIAGYFFLFAGGIANIFFNNVYQHAAENMLPPAIFSELGTLIEMFFFALALGHKKKILEIEKKQADLKNLELQIFSLRAQMNPHFIFNCLNSIKLFTTQNDTLSATEYLTKFSRLIRVVMENSRNERITLAAEMNALRLYLDMEVMRFKEKLRYHINIHKGVDTDYIEIPPLLLQPYVENAIWHGLMPKEAGGIINIEISVNSATSHLQIQITDNGIGRKRSGELQSKTAIKHKSYGMKVTAERLAMINQLYKTGASVSVLDLSNDNETAVGTRVIIIIPLE